ncbi:MAG TPA: hypothetical protein PK402_13925, partial [Tepidisphaeraceae bacterium]|nr:hypothetical protein [Tepidisphaeraceae bacterium]
DGGNLDLSTRMVFTDLRLKEPSDGPIGRALNLPAPIDAVIGAIQDPGGSITLPINVPVRAGEVNIGSVIGSGIGAVSQVVITAFASAPLKILNLGGDGPPAPDDVVLTFSAGDAYITPELQTQIEALVQKMRKDKNLEVTIRHDMGSADLERALVRSNPTREDAMDLANSLRAEKSALLAEREGLVVAAQAELATRPEDQAEALDRLRSLDARIAEIDSAMGELYDLLKKGAELQATARQRNAGATLARVRIEAVRSLLIRKDVERSDTRVQAITPSLDSTVEGAGRIVIVGTTKQRAR